MKKDRFYYPIPEGKLLKRFSPIFRKIYEGYSGTLVSLPHTGRTSHLRFISSQKNILNNLSLSPERFINIFIDIDRTDGTFDSFLGETINSLLDSSGYQMDNQEKSFLNSKDTYLLVTQLLRISKALSEQKRLVFVVTLKDRVAKILREIDNLMVHTQKNAYPGNISILWSIDTKILRSYEPAHLSTSILDNVFYFPTFDEEETLHSIERYASLKGRGLPENKLKNAYLETGGIAAFFHAFVLFAQDGVSTSLKDSFNKSENKIVEDLIKESKLNPPLFDKLTTLKAKEFLDKKSTTQTTPSGKIKFHTKPRAQEILILEILKNNIGNPVSRDALAQTLWGKAWQTKYSDWAIDKAMERLRKNLASGEFTIITVKNIGYQLIKI